MNFCVKLLSIFLVLVMLASTVISCAFQPNSNPPTQGGTTTNNGITVLPPNNDDNKEDINNGNNGNHVGGVVVGNATAPYIGDVHVSAGVTPDENNQVPSEGVNLESATASATIPGGVQMEEGANELSLTINGIKDSSANVELSDTDVSTSLDVHVSGVAANNLVPMEVKLLAAALKGLNSTSITLYHVENGETIAMTYVPNDEPFTAHNQFKYDPVTGDVTLYIASFSEIMMVSDTVNAWEGKFDYTWYDANKTEFVIANADQLAAFGAIVGGMKKVTGRVDGKYTYSEEIIQDSFKDKIVKLIADIDLGDAEENNKDIIFYPIGYWNNEGTYERKPLEERETAVSSGFYTFEGTFDGNGHTIENFYQNTWEMKGDHDWYNTTTEQYYRDGMGLFGRLYKATVKNLTVKNFSSDGEIATTGVIAAYADGATFENISIFNCNPRVYNIGNGGIVGCVGWYAKEANLKTTFKNITVDNSNKISALWGSYDVACGGIVGQYYPTSGQSSVNYPVNGGINFENCHVSAVMDVYNDVCANYQYYAYRYTGMLIGSVRENVTIDGHVYPKMDGITASGCTVHFGTWNDYYYCEIIDNTTASYTHDYQMSRLTEIKAINGTTITYLDGTTGTVPASGRANYVIVDYSKGHGTENATCYHFKDGAVWTHDMGGIQEGIDENGDGQDDLKEDKQHIYLEFNNLVTGYGWGVTSKGLEDFKGVTNMDITQGEYEFSVEKFEGKVNTLVNQKVFTFGEIFNLKNNPINVPLKPDALKVAVTNLDKNNPVSATIVYDEKNWENGTIIFEGTGAIQITIQDYYFCTPTTIDVTITERQNEVKFDVVLNNGDFLHRVGNEKAVSLQSLFKAKDGVTIGSNVQIIIENTRDSSDKSDTTTPWANSGIEFEGTGVVTVTITDNDWCVPTVITLQVIDAVNATTATSATSNNVVLLNDCGFSSLEVSGGYTLYGNGFTMTCASDSYALDMGYAFVTLDNGTLDNVQIVCPNFDYAVLYKKNMTSSDNRNHTDANGTTRYYNVKSGVMVSGNSQILNSRISGGRAAVNVASGNCVIDNSRIELGAVASLLVGAANSLTLKDVTLVQKPTESTYKNPETNIGTTIMGFSVLYLCDSEGNATPTTIQGELVQYAWASSNSSQYVPQGADGIISTVLGKNEYIHNINKVDSVNLGFAYMPADDNRTVNKPSNITDNRTNVNVVPYFMEQVSATIYYNGFPIDITTYVYTYKNTNGTHESFAKESKYEPSKYSDIITVNYSDSKDGLESGKSFGTNGWTYELNVDLDKVPGYTLDFSKLSMVVNGIPVTDFKVNGGSKPSPVAVTAGGVTYTLTATVDGKEYTVKFKVTGTETSKESPTLVSTNYEAGICIASSYGGTWSGAAPALKGIQIRYWSVDEKQYKTIDLGELAITGTGKLNGTNSTWTYTHTNNDFTLTLTGGQVHSSNNIYAMPVAVEGTLYFVPADSKGLVNSGNSARSIPVSYSFKDNNGGDVLTFSHSWSVAENKDEQFKYSDFCNGTKTQLSGGITECVTPDTLITLADGSQVRVDSLTGNEMLLVWNMETGKFDVAPIMFLDSDPEAEYEVIRLYFSDGTYVNVISEHGFWDYDLNRYVYLDRNAADYIGHTFAKQNGDKLEKVQLVDVVIETETTTAWSPVTVGHLCYFVNGMLSMPGGVGGLFNIFEVDPETMTYDYEQIEKDIATYGLFTYEELNAICPLTEEMFNAAGGAYLKISIGKGNLTMDELIAMITRYSKYI